MDVFSVLTSLVGAVAAIAAVIVAVRALRASRQAAFAEPLVAALRSVRSNLSALASSAEFLAASGSAETASVQTATGTRQLFRATYESFDAASAAVALLEQILAPDTTAYGTWIRGVANALATNLRDAGEASDGPAGPEPDRPPEVPAGDWETLRRSVSYRSARATSDALGSRPAGRPGIAALDSWWAAKVLAHSAAHSVYGIEAGDLAQHSRLLDDFLREYFDPWAVVLLRSSLD